ncbi:toxin ParE1/3/4 [Methylobacillus rhizosphaerae]|uniref:Toxin n=1 Tax=Methylobacillus rhizosphaerae TaxID=551994 RepID=A0A239ARN5_9PROT|nr:type II toxin-antitoxin system RelE/ParE family toxin [Methylobacillus rhizosphaerae]SNR98190.1 toxin ParE1/3/4 [Methylobacillus rhizosphaerae]
MVKTYRLSPLAEADLEEIWLYTFRHWSIEQADSYYRDLVATFEGLVAGTKQGRPSVLPGYQKYLCGSHVVYFLDYADHLDVIRILHQRQDAERHL